MASRKRDRRKDPARRVTVVGLGGSRKRPPAGRRIASQRLPPTEVKRNQGGRRPSDADASQSTATANRCEKKFGENQTGMCGQ